MKEIKLSALTTLDEVIAEQAAYTRSAIFVDNELLLEATIAEVIKTSPTLFVCDTRLQPYAGIQVSQTLSEWMEAKDVTSVFVSNYAHLEHDVVALRGNDEFVVAMTHQRQLQAISDMPVMPSLVATYSDSLLGSVFREVAHLFPTRINNNEEENK